MVRAAASSWPALDLDSVFWVRPVAALASRSRKVRNTRIGARPFLMNNGRPNRGRKRDSMPNKRTWSRRFLAGENLGNEESIEQNSRIFDGCSDNPDSSPRRAEDLCGPQSGVNIILEEYCLERKADQLVTQKFICCNQN